MGTADLKATFGSAKHELNVSTYQMCILLLFNQVTLIPEKYDSRERARVLCVKCLSCTFFHRDVAVLLKELRKGI